MSKEKMVRSFPPTGIQKIDEYLSGVWNRSGCGSVIMIIEPRLRVDDTPGQEAEVHSLDTIVDAMEGGRTSELFAVVRMYGGFASPNPSVVASNIAGATNLGLSVAIHSEHDVAELRHVADLVFHRYTTRTSTTKFNSTPSGQRDIIFVEKNRNGPLSAIVLE